MSRMANCTSGLLGLACVTLAATAQAEDRQALQSAESAESAALFDITGQWVALITEDWRWRMITPPKGDYTSVPLNAAGVAKLNEWDLAADNAAGRNCLSYGAGGLLRMPLRMRITWSDTNTLRVTTDKGGQERDFHFVSAKPGALVPAMAERAAPDLAPSLQGYSRAQWFAYPQSRGLGFEPTPPPDGGSLRVVIMTTSGGYLRKNGVPYSSDAVITEQFDIVKLDERTTFLVLTTKVDDPTFLREPFIISSSFRRETDPSKWSPEPCVTDEPLSAALASAD